MFNLFKKVTPELKSTKPIEPAGDVVERANDKDSLFKAYIPQFLYKPPFGYPRGDNVPLIKQVAKNAYVFSVILRLQEEAAWADWDLKPADDSVEMTPELKTKRNEIKQFLKNPNGNKEGFSDIVKKCVRDICEIDAGVWVKIFGRDKKMKQIMAYDGGTFLKNPNIYGSIGDREDFVMPIGNDLMIDAGMGEQEAMRRYAFRYNTTAAYFQYGWQTASFPIPFGRREVMYFMKNPRSDSIYGISPVMILTDIILTLVYGSNYNLDFYMNSNMPEGIVQLLGASNEEVQAFKARMAASQKTTDQSTGFQRRVGYLLPVVNREAEFKAFQLPAKEMQILEQQAWFTKVVWMCFGVSADDMGFTEDSNKAVSGEQGKKYARKAVKPILNLIAERINMEIIPEFGTTDLCFEFDDYDIDEDIRRHELYEKQIQMGIKTSEMVAEEEKIDLTKLEATKEKQLSQEKEHQNAMNPGFQEKEETPKDEKKPNTKASVVEKGQEVKCTTNGEYAGRIGTVERIVNGFYYVRFGNGLGRFDKSELLNMSSPEANEKEVTVSVKANNMQSALLKEIDEKAKLVEKTLKRHYDGGLKNIS